LQTKAESLGLGTRINWLGARPQDEVLAAYRASDLFVLGSRIAPDGDRDGLPNVLLEAGAQELAVVATRMSAVPELIEDGVNGCLVEPGEAEPLAAAIAELSRDPARRLRLGRAGRQIVLERFAMDPGIDALAARLRATLAEAPKAAA